jgi:hypothetical protein
VPDVAALAGILVVYMSLFSGVGVERLLGDSDTGWHIVTG